MHLRKSAGDIHETQGMSESAVKNVRRRARFKFSRRQECWTPLRTHGLTALRSVPATLLRPLLPLHVQPCPRCA